MQSANRTVGNMVQWLTFSSSFYCSGVNIIWGRKLRWKFRQSYYKSRCMVQRLDQVQAGFTGTELICGEIHLFPMTAAMDNKSFVNQLRKRVKVTFREVQSRQNIAVIKKTCFIMDSFSLLPPPMVYTSLVWQIKQQVASAGFSCFCFRVNVPVIWWGFEELGCVWFIHRIRRQRPTQFPLSTKNTDWSGPHDSAICPGRRPGTYTRTSTQFPRAKDARAIAASYD